MTILCGVGRRLKHKIEEYEYDSNMEPVYRNSMLKQFVKTLSDGYFNMIIVDAVNSKVCCPVKFPLCALCHGVYSEVNGVHVHVHVHVHVASGSILYLGTIVLHATLCNRIGTAYNIKRPSVFIGDVFTVDSLNVDTLK